MSYSAKVVADSITDAGSRLTTMEVTFPRLILAEFNTHRVFSRNSASSRAIPTKKQIQRVNDNPFVPEYWGLNQKGMQADNQADNATAEQARDSWLAAKDSAVQSATNMYAMGLHKQLVNRILEPFMWHTVIVTATEWSNFFALRTHKDAQPEIRKIAVMMQDQYQNSTPSLINQGEWHLPLIQPDEYDGNFEYTKKARQISAARCARVSYLTHDGKRDHSKDLELYERLVQGGHMSPLEHVATPYWCIYSVGEQENKAPLPKSIQSGNFYGWKQYRKFLPNENDYSKVL